MRVRVSVRSVIGLFVTGLLAGAVGCETPQPAEDPGVEQPPVEQPDEPDTVAEEVGDVGDVDFETSCTDEAQQHFEVGLGLLHHMWYTKAREAFDEVVAADPECAMGYWGRAMTYYTPLWAPPDDEALEAGAEAVDQARQLEATEREGMFIEAVGAFFDDHEQVDHAERAEAFRDGWEQAHERDPEDVEAASFYALSILSTAPVVTDTYDDQERAGRLVEEVLEQEPDHPGGHHYLLHAYDFPPLAERAEEVARDYADIAPEVPHALHMPAHIFVRLGEWEDTIEWDLRAADAAEQHRVNDRLPMDFYHSLDYVTHAYLQLGLDDDATETVERARQADTPDEHIAAAYASVAMPARLAVEQRDWDEAADLEPLHADELPFEQWPAVQVVEYTVRTTGAAFGGDAEAARQHFERVDELEQEVAELDDPHWSPHARAYRDMAEAHLEYAEGNVDAAVVQLEEVAEFQDTFDKHPIMPARILEATEYLGMMLHEQGEYTSALEAYERGLERTPNRYRLVYGAAVSAREAGLDEEARRYYEALLELADPDEVDRPEVDEAREYLDDLRARR